MAPKRLGQQEQAVPLRATASTADPSHTQEVALAALLCAEVIAGNGVYAVRYLQSGAIKLKLYVDGKAYEDVLNVSEDWAPLFHDYAKQTGCLVHYQALIAAWHVARDGRPLEAREGASEGEGTDPPPRKGSTGRA